MILNNYGHIVLDEWMETAIICPGVSLDEFIVMPSYSCHISWMQTTL